MFFMFFKNINNTNRKIFKIMMSLNIMKNLFMFIGLFVGLGVGVYLKYQSGLPFIILISIFVGVFIGLGIDSLLLGNKKGFDGFVEAVYGRKIQRKESKVINQ